MSTSVASEDPLLAGIYAHALDRNGDLERAITFLTKAVESHSEYSNLKLQLARLLLARSLKPGALSRQRDQDDALDLARCARDLRRSWRGETRQAVQVACQAALISSRYGEVIALGTGQPDGEATVDEAADPEVQFSVAQAALAAGKLDAVKRTVAATTGFHQALIQGDLLHSSSAPPTDIGDQFQLAWSLATTEENKVAVWLGASGAGVEPLPGADELATRTDDIPLLCEALGHIANGRHDQAIDTLRPNRTSEAGRRLLTNAYLNKGDIDAAVEELLDMARRFSNVDHRVRAVEVLVGVNRLDQAAMHADETLPMVSITRNAERNLLHEVGVASAHNRGDWADMERRVRAWINESGPDRRRRWMLAGARFNQADPQGAWHVLEEGESCDATTASEARLWIILHSRFRPTAETMSAILALTECYSGDNEIRALAVNAFLLIGDSIDIADNELARWQELTRDRADNPDPSDTFTRITIPDDPEGLAEALRPHLEPQARRLEEWRDKVRRDGWPYGTLAIAAGRPYVSALVHRAAGFLPIASGNPDVAADEEATAIEALQTGRVIIDNSVVITSWFIRELWPKLLGAFISVETTEDSRRDAATASDSFKPRSSDTLSWDLRTGRPMILETDAQELDRLESHLTWVNEQVATLGVRPNVDADRDRGAKVGCWMTAFQTARSVGLPLWADDNGLRSLARNEGVRTFGTDGLLKALHTQGRLTQAEVDQATLRYRTEFCVDFPLDPEWMVESARQSGWGPGPALLALSRASAWSDLSSAFKLWERLVDEAGSSDPARVAVWVYGGGTAIASLLDVVTAQQLVASLVVKAAAAVRSDAEAFAKCVEAAVRVSAESGLADPTESALKMAMELLERRVGPALAASQLARIGASLRPEHKGVLRGILFDIQE